jgi:hypothetical protein
MGRKRGLNAISCQRLLIQQNAGVANKGIEPNRFIYLLAMSNEILPYTSHLAFQPNICKQHMDLSVACLLRNLITRSLSPCSAAAYHVDRTAFGCQKARHLFSHARICASDNERTLCKVQWTFQDVW